MVEVDQLDLWLDGQHAGTLTKDETGNVEFSYNESYARSEASTPVSLSMPKRELHHGPRTVMPWLSNLLPDAPEVRERWAARFAERHSDPFTLLRHMGQDAPGSVQIVRRGEQPDQSGTLTPVSQRVIAQRVQGIFADPELWIDDRDDAESRFSLAGNQGKFALAYRDGGWYEANGRAASTHIVKPGMTTLQGFSNETAQAIEFMTMRAARAVGVRTATVEIEEFDGQLAFVTARYDRLHTATGTVQRIHQEDVCQALAIPPSRKYEADGGPTMGDMVALVSESVSVGAVVSDMHMLAKLMAFNLLVAGVDAHAKNHSLILLGNEVRLAPAYDLISAHGLWDEQRVRYKASAAVKYGKERHYRAMSGRDLARTADTLQLGRHEFRELLAEMTAELPVALASAHDQLPEPLQSESTAAMPERTHRFATLMLENMSVQDIADTPKFVPQRQHHLHEAGHQNVWEPGKLQNGVWKPGRYRGRSGLGLTHA